MTNALFIAHLLLSSATPHEADIASLIVYAEQSPATAEVVRAKSDHVRRLDQAERELAVLRWARASHAPAPQWVPPEWTPPTPAAGPAVARPAGRPFLPEPASGSAPGLGNSSASPAS